MHLTLKLYTKFALFAILLLATTPLLKAQQQRSDDPLLKAMQDELDRNMGELKLPGYDKPFFIMYGILDQKLYSVSAILGALGESSENHQRIKTNTRILVGDYSFNDESLEDNLFSSPTAIEIDLPVDNDYAGIRRAFWSTTDKVYRDAAHHYEKNKETLKETGKALADIPHRSFAKSAPITILTPAKLPGFDRASIESQLKKLSALFLQHPTIVNAVVSLQYREGYQYLLNSEGTTVKIPVQLATLTCAAQSKNEAGEFAFDNIIHIAKAPSGLPAVDQLTLEIKNMIDNLEHQFDTPKIDEPYTGPVLVMGSAVAEVFSSMLFKTRENVFASDNITKLTGYKYENDKATMEAKIGKSIINEAITVKAKPRLTAYNGLDLLGSFEIDNEGVVPAEELVIIEKGILKNLLNNRTLTTTSQTANGFASGPGVIEVTSTFKHSEKVLKDKLIAAAKIENLDYAIIVREVPSFFSMQIVNVYKVSVADGKETLMRKAALGQGGFKTMKRVLGASEKYKAYNLVGNSQRRGADIGLVSFIVPEAILLQEMEIEPVPMPSLKEEEYVSNPLK